MAREARTLSVLIDRSAVEAYDFLSVPENFARWASGLAASLRRHGEDWVAETPQGPATVRFSEPNGRGVLDHAVLMQDRSVYVPLRVVAKGAGCELVLTLYREPDTPDEKFEADAQWVMRDLEAAKRILEVQVKPGVRGSR
jgi:hypothetical protein